MCIIPRLFYFSLFLFYQALAQEKERESSGSQSPTSFTIQMGEAAVNLYQEEELGKGKGIYIHIRTGFG